MHDNIIAVLAGAWGVVYILSLLMANDIKRDFALATVSLIQTSTIALLVLYASHIL